MFKFRDAEIDLGQAAPSRRYASIAEARDPRLHQLYAYWNKCRGSRLMPARADIDPLDIPKLLPDIALISVVPDVPIEQRFVMKVFGTKLRDSHEVDWTGKSLFETAPRAAAERIALAANTVVTKREPWIATGSLYWVPEKSFLAFEVLQLPLSDDGKTVNLILALNAIFQASERETTT